MPPLADLKIYHIVHVDRLKSIIANNGLLCDAEIVRREMGGEIMGSMIGLSDIKARRLNELQLESRPGLFVGQCVPFYFCPRSVMLYMISSKNPKLNYKGGQGPILHLEANMTKTVEWADHWQRRWAFTLSNAGSRYFEDRADIAQLGEIDWVAVQARSWKDKKGAKQAEFLVEQSFPWNLVSRIGVKSHQTCEQVRNALRETEHKPCVEIKSEWYY